MKILILTLMMVLNLRSQAKQASAVNPKNGNVTFEVTVDQGINKVPYLLLYQQGYYRDDAALVGRTKVFAHKIQGNTYSFELKHQTKPLYFSVFLKDPLFDIEAVKQYHFEPGDQVKILINPTRLRTHFKLAFTGIGSAKYKCKNEIIALFSDQTIPRNPSFTKESEYVADNSEMRFVGLSYKVIEQYKPELSDYSYNLLHADVLGSMGYNIFSSLKQTLLLLKSKSDAAGFRKVADSFKQRFAYDFTKNIPENVLFESRQYSDFLLLRIYCESFMELGEVNYNGIFDHIKRVNSTLLRDRLILNFFIAFWSKVNLGALLPESYDIVGNQSILKRVKSFEHNIPGNKAYNFSLENADGKKISLSDFKGKVVFIDFWFTGCGACTVYFTKVVSKAEEVFRKNPDVVFVSICIDSKERWLKSLAEGKYTSAHTVNLYTNGEEDNHELIKYYNVMSYPRPMIIGKDGKIANINETLLKNSKGLVETIEKELIMVN